MFTKLVLISFILTILTSYAIGDKLTISQTQTSSWSVNGQPFTVWEAKVTNTGSRIIYDATIIGESNLELENIWSLEQKSSNKFSFPKFISQNSGLKNGTYFTFGYINKSSQSAIFSVCDIIN
ncbi:hypothetical protein RB653_002141 [Dictyostelium firmibasis]|uniref:Carbohydrate binding domain-containing protein n=1 Tax=Dictyostelium firmibasis TaxID=79012 RepID=A0AAN7YPS8_9MYCE